MMSSTSNRESQQEDAKTRDATLGPTDNNNNSSTLHQPKKRDPKPRRTATLYDAVAGKIGINGFLTPSQLHTDHPKTSTPEEVLLRRLNAPDTLPGPLYNADEHLGPDQKLPDSDLLKDLHVYVSDFYELHHNHDAHHRSNFDFDFDFKSLDETALLAMGILLEEACKQSLGQTGDMAFTEPASRDRQKSPRTNHPQIIGRVVPKVVREYQSSSESEDAEVEGSASHRRKRARRRYRSPED